MKSNLQVLFNMDNVCIALNRQENQHEERGLIQTPVRQNTLHTNTISKCLNQLFIINGRNPWNLKKS